MQPGCAGADDRRVDLAHRADDRRAGRAAADAPADVNPRARLGFPAARTVNAYTAVVSMEIDMWRINVALPHDIRVTITSGALFWVTACVAVALLMWAFVAVLHQGIERGERLRAAQRQAATQTTRKVAAPTVRTAQLAQPAAKE